MRSVIQFFTFLFAAACGCLGQAQEKQLSAKEVKALYDKADHALNAAWAVAKEKLTAEEFNELKEDQRAWLEYRDYLARSTSYAGGGEQDENGLLRDSPAYLEAAAGLAKERTEWLRGLVAQWPDDSLTGIWNDSHGGWVTIVQQDGHLFFDAECARGHSIHLGSLLGVAVWNAPLGWYSDKGEDKDKEEETNLCFIQRDKKLELVGAKTKYYHGARAYFDGSYIKVRELSAVAQKKVIQEAKAGVSADR